MHPETRVFRGADSDDFMILACIALIRCQCVTDIRTDRQTSLLLLQLPVLLLLLLLLICGY